MRVCPLVERESCVWCGVVGLEYNICMMQHWPGNVVAAQEVCDHCLL